MNWFNLLSKHHVFTLQKLPMPCSQRTDCSGSSMSVYTSASSCFLPPATCSSVTLSPCSLVWAYRHSRHQSTDHSSVTLHHLTHARGRHVAPHGGRGRAEDDVAGSVLHTGPGARSRGYSATRLLFILTQFFTKSLLLNTMIPT